MSEVNKEANIYQKINSVMRIVQYVQKDKSVSGGGANYKAVTHDQVVSVVRQALVDNGVMIYPNQLSGEFLQMRDVNALPQPVKMGLYTGTYEINFVNVDGGDKVTVTLQAHANDNGDKAPGKALTYATKAAILKVLCLETGENDESRVEQLDLDTINIDQQNQLFTLLCTPEGNLNEKGVKIQAAYKFNTFADIKSKKYQQILKAAS